MTDGKYIDFDAALAESEKEPVVVRFQGRDWELYPALPAKPVLRLMRMRAGDDEADLDRGEMLDLLCGMVPAGVFEAWLDGGLTLDQLARLLRMLMSAYRIGGEEASGEGEAEGPAAGPTASSSTGPR